MCNVSVVFRFAQRCIVFFLITPNFPLEMEINYVSITYVSNDLQKNKVGREYMKGVLVFYEQKN